MILFSDNEPAMKALKQAVVEAMKDLELTLQESPTSAGHENAPSNGTAESAVREVKRMMGRLHTNVHLDVNGEGLQLSSGNKYCSRQLVLKVKRENLR